MEKYYNQVKRIIIAGNDTKYFEIRLSINKYKVQSIYW